MQRHVALSLVLAGVLLSGCSESGSAGPSPSPSVSPSATVSDPREQIPGPPVALREIPVEWKLYRGHGVAFRVPPTWELEEKLVGEGGFELVIEGGVGAEGLPRQVLMSGRGAQELDLGSTLLDAELPEQQVVRRLRLELEGALESSLVEKTFTTEAEVGGAPVAARQVEIRVITRDQRYLNFIVRSSAKDFDELLLRELVATFGLLGPEDLPVESPVPTPR